MTALLLAGGMGTRIRHLHPDLPKPMIPVAGKPFLEWGIRYWA
ncbi:MAG: nucleotidyltransferase, partial [Acidobacteria bacterium]|nr:nucleotidyltransferase [Acidobacteriota bacterium]